MRRIAPGVLALFAVAACAVAQPSEAPTQTPPATASVSEAPPADQISPLPPPATRAGLRGRWFEFLSALHDDDFPAAAVALTDILKTADRVGISRLSDFSRAALQEARLARRLAKRERAAAAYGAAIRLDPDLPDARWERARFSWTGGRKSRALLEEIEGVTALLSS